MPEFTARQAEDWPKAVAQLAAEGLEVSERLEHYCWHIKWQDETRAGRGHFFSATWVDGEHVAQVTMDVYGYPRVSYGDIDWIHSDSDEECAHCLETDA